MVTGLGLAAMKRSMVLAIGVLGASLICSHIVMAAELQETNTGESPDPLRRRAVELFRSGDRIEALAILKQARAAYEEVLTHTPDDYEATRKLAMTLFDLGEYETSQEVFKRALALREKGQQSEPSAAKTMAEQPKALTAPPGSTHESVPIPVAIRGIEVHPDVLFDSAPDITAGNIGAFVARAVEMNVNVVYVHGLTEPEADGSYANAYFDALIAPMRADILKPMAEQLHTNNIRIHVIMPVLSLALPETDDNRAMMVMSMGIDKVRPSPSWRKRLSPFNTNGLALMIQLYEDLAKAVPLDGVVFGDDGYLTDTEDLNPAAVENYKETLGIQKFSLDSLQGEQEAILADLKAKQLDSWCGSLMASVKASRPETLFSRTLYAAAIHHPPSKAWLAQDYGEALKMYDMVYALADPEMEDLNRSTSWLVNLVEQAASEPSRPGKTVFRIPTYSEKHAHWHSERYLARVVDRMTEAGAIHFVLGPDDVVVDRPRLRKEKKVFQEAP